MRHYLYSKAYHFLALKLVGGISDPKQDHASLSCGASIVKGW